MMIVDFLCFYMVVNTPIPLSSYLLDRSRLYEWMIGRAGFWSYRQELRAERAERAMSAK